MNKIKYFSISIIVLLLLSFVYFVTYNFVEPKTYDFMTKHVLTEKLSFDKEKNVYGHDDIILVVIDDITAQKYRWPWKRELFCKIFDYFLDYAHPKIIVHDALLATLDTENPESDKKLFKTFGRFNNLVEGFMLNNYEWDDAEKGKIYDKKFEKKFGLKNYISEIEFKSDWLNSLVAFPDEYFNTISDVGSVIVDSGYINNYVFKDDVIRTYDYLVSYKNSLYPSLALQTFIKMNNYPQIIVKKDTFEFPDYNYKIKFNNNNYRINTPIKFYKLSNSVYSHQTVSALSVMDCYDKSVQAKKDVCNGADFFKDKIVIVGANVAAGEGLWDTANTSMSARQAGVDIQATAIDNIVHNDFLKILPQWLNILIMIVIMLFIYYTIRTHELFKAITLTLSTIILYILSSAVCFYHAIIVNIAAPTAMFIVTMIIAYVHRYTIENKNKKKVENLLGKYMSEDVMKNLIQDIDNLGLGGKKAIVSVLFSDIRGFTSMSEKMSAEEVMTNLNEYFSAMEPIVRKHNGIINKFIGDAVMAIFGEPIHDENHAQNAVLCGLEMLQKVQELNKQWEEEGKQKIEIGIGINTGEVFVGNIGSEKRMEYTVIGDTVNLASRLESYNKTFNTKMLISASTFEESKNIVEAREITDVEIRGKANKITIYDIIKLQNEAY